MPTSIGGWEDGRKERELKTKSLHFSSKRRGTKTIKNITTSDHHAERQTVFCVQTRPDKNASPDLEPNCLQKLFEVASYRERENGASTQIGTISGTSK